MSTRCTAISRAVLASKPFGNSDFIGLLGSVVLALLFVSSPLVRAEEPDAKYMRIYNFIEQADSLAKRGQMGPAKAKYQAAQAALKDLKSLNPTWNTKAVSYRLSYVTEKIEGLSQSPATSSALPAGIEVKLISAGAEPRQLLRLQAKPGETQKALMTLQMAMGMGGGGELMKIPAIKIMLEVEPKSITAAGDIESEMHIDDIELGEGGAPQMADAMKSSLGGLKGMVITSTLSDLGASKKSEVKLPPEADAAARQALEQVKDSFLNTQFVLPEEPVGVGAEWQVKQKIKAQGMTIDQTTTFHLVAMDGKVLTVESSIAQSAANQKVANPAMPQLKVDLTKMTGATKGQMTVDLTKILPTEATTTGGSEMVMSAGAGAQASAMTMKAELSLKIEAK